MTISKKTKKRYARFTPAGRLYLELLNRLNDYSVEEIQFLCDKTKERDTMTVAKKNTK